MGPCAECMPKLRSEKKNAQVREARGPACKSAILGTGRGKGSASGRGGFMCVRYLPGRGLKVPRPRRKEPTLRQLLADACVEDDGGGRPRRPRTGGT